MTKKILLIENVTADFYKARVPLGKYLINEGFEIFALVPEDDYARLIEKENIKVIEYPLSRKDKSIFQIIRLFRIYNKIIKEYDFDIIHSFRFQPNLLNVLVNFFNKRKVIVHITGLGIAFSNNSFKYLLFRLFSQIIYLVMLFRADKFIVQNEEDIKDIWFSNVWKKKIQVIYGSGVDTDTFDIKLYNRIELREKNNILSCNIVFVCITRLIWEKGIREMVQAFQDLSKINKNVKLIIIGWQDFDNPRHVDKEFINKFDNHDSIFFLGKKDDIREFLCASDVFLFPSYYREGIPRGLLEALSMGLPIITTDMPGCNLTVKENYNGYIITPRSKESIIDAVNKIVNNNNFQEMSKNSRQLALNKFSNSIIFKQISDLYIL